MTVQEIWLANLCAIVDREAKGKNLRAGYRAVAEESGLSEEYIYQLYQKKPKSNGQLREVSPGAAKKIASAFADGRPEGWFDQLVVDLHKTTRRDPQNRPSFHSNEVPGLTLESRESGHKSHLFPVTPAPLDVKALNWEQLMESVLKEGLDVLKQGLWAEIGDKAMAPDLIPGDRVLLQSGVDPVAEDDVLVRTQDGDLALRRYRRITSAVFEVWAMNGAGYGTLRSDTDKVEVLAVVMERNIKRRK